MAGEELKAGSRTASTGSKYKVLVLLTVFHRFRLPSSYYRVVGGQVQVKYKYKLEVLRHSPKIIMPPLRFKYKYSLLTNAYLAHS